MSFLRYPDTYIDRYHNRPAVRQFDEAGNCCEIYTYADLWKKTIFIANSIPCFVSEQLKIGLVATNSIEWIAADLALLKLGVCEVPVPMAFTAEQAENLLRSCSYVLVDEQGSHQIKEWAKERPKIAEIPSIFLPQIGESDAAHSAPEQSSVRSLCKVIHTSGSTSNPKGVRITIDGLDAVIHSLSSLVNPDYYKNYLSVVPFSLLIEQICAIYIPFTLGGAVSLLPKSKPVLGERGSSTKSIVNFTPKVQPSALTIPPALVAAYVDVAHQNQRLGPRELSTLLFGAPTAPLIAAGGGSVSKALLTALADRGIDIFQGYGLSEASSVVCWNTPNTNKFGTVGRPLPHISYQIEDDGELKISSVALCDGYETLDPSACPIKESVLYTGDIASVDDDGFISIIGRKKNLIITAAGRNVSPEPIESMLKESSEVIDVIVVGEGKELLSAIVILKNESEKENVEKKLRSTVEQSLSHIEQISTFIFLEDSPSLRETLFTITGRPKRDIAQEFIENLQPAMKWELGPVSA